MKRTVLFLLSFSLFNFAKSQAWTNPDPAGNTHTIGTGFVGIGATAPAANLHISNINNTEAIIESHNDGYAGLRLISNNVGWQWTTRIAAEQHAFQLLHWDGTNTTAPWSNALISFLSSGNIGIGTSVPGSFKLAVEGTLGARKVIVTQASPWPDYVFSKGYRPLPLDSLSFYISQHHHLPEIPSADSVAKSGLDIGVNQALLLQKIEELTLYLLTQNQELQTCKKEEEALKQENCLLKDQVRELSTLNQRITRLEQQLACEPLLHK